MFILHKFINLKFIDNYLIFKACLILNINNNNKEKI